MESQKQSVFNLKNRPFLKKEIISENYGQLKRANDILTQEVKSGGFRLLRGSGGTRTLRWS